jgi:hypothetical protein
VTAAGRVIRWTTALAVVGVATVAAVASYEHAYALVRAHGEAGWTGRMVPLTVDGLIYASSMVMLNAPRIRSSSGQLRYSLINWQRIACLRFVRSVRGSTPASPVRSGCGTTSPREQGERKTSRR